MDTLTMACEYALWQNWLACPYTTWDEYGDHIFAMSGKGAWKSPALARAGAESTARLQELLDAWLAAAPPTPSSDGA